MVSDENAKATADKPAPGAEWVTNQKGEFELRNPCGAVVAQVLHWPHSRGDWLTIKAPEDWRDSGMKRFRTARGGKAYLCRKLPAADLDHQL